MCNRNERELTISEKQKGGYARLWIQDSKFSFISCFHFRAVQTTPAVSSVSAARTDIMGILLSVPAYPARVQPRRGTLPAGVRSCLTETLCASVKKATPARSVTGQQIYPPRTTFLLFFISFSGRTPAECRVKRAPWFYCRQSQRTRSRWG